MTIPVHTLATVDEDAEGRCRYVCSCGARGRFVGSIMAPAVPGKGKPAEIASADERARGSHQWHATLASDPTRPPDWGSV